MQVLGKIRLSESFLFCKVVQPYLLNSNPTSNSKNAAKSYYRMVKLG